jgi:hypothetical protein
MLRKILLPPSSGQNSKYAGQNSSQCRQARKDTLPMQSYCLHTVYIHGPGPIYRAVLHKIFVTDDSAVCI